MSFVLAHAPPPLHSLAGNCLYNWSHPGGVNGISVSSDGTVATACDDKIVRTYSLSTGECTRTLEGHNAWIASVCMATNDLLFSGDGKEGVRVWSLTAGERCSPP